MKYRKHIGEKEQRKQIQAWTEQGWVSWIQTAGRHKWTYGNEQKLALTKCQVEYDVNDKL